MFKIYYLLVIILSSIATVNADPFSSEADVFKTTSKTPGHIIYIPITSSDITFFIPQVKEDKPSLTTLDGEDLDNNNIRDYVQNIIIDEYSNDDYLRTRSLLMAKLIQDISSTRTSDLNYTLTKIQNLQYCMYKTKGLGHGEQFVMPYALNTYQRSIAFLTNARNTISSNGTPQVNACN